MFEHKHLDGQTNRVIPSTDAFINGDVLECRDGLIKDLEAISRKQYSVVGDLLVERCLPPENIGDTWSHDSVALPWWTKVMNPPHMGIVAEFNSHNGGLHRKPLDLQHNVAAFAAEGEEVLFTNGAYTVVRKSDGQEITAPTLVELRKLYYS
jgi:hypothetical protein